MDLDGPDDLILGFHLNQLDAEERAKLQGQFAEDPALKARSERLGRALRPLDAWSVPSEPVGLPEKVLSAIERRRIETEAAASMLTLAEEGRRLRFVPMRDLLAVAACLVLIMSVMLPGISEVRGRTRKTQCAANLRALASGLGVYRHIYQDSLPYAGQSGNASWLPTGAESRGYASNSRHLFRLLKAEIGIVPEDFVCPSGDSGEPMILGNLSTQDDFSTARNVSYDSHNLAGPNPNLRPAAADLAYLSDANPLFVGGRFHDAVDPDTTNSPAHRGRGQTVLLLDGSAELHRSPVYGPRQDNLWTLRGIRRYSGNESAAGPDDAFLVPGIPVSDLGLAQPR